MINLRCKKIIEMYRLFPLRVLRRTTGVLFDEIVPSDIPKISGRCRADTGSAHRS